MLTRKFFRFLIKDKVIFLSVIAILLINFATWMNLFRIKKADGLIPLHYNIYFGIDYMGEWYKIFTLPIIGLIIFSVNLFISIFVYFKDKFISYILLVSAILIQIILFLSSLAVVWINI